MWTDDDERMTVVCPSRGEFQSIAAEDTGSGNLAAVRIRRGK